MGATAPLASSPRSRAVQRAAKGLRRAAAESVSRALTPRLARARALVLLLDDVRDQSDDLLDAGDLRVAVLERSTPVLDAAVDRQLVELSAVDRQAHLRVGRDVLRDLRAGQLNAVELHIAPPAQLQSDDESQRLQRRNFREEVPHALLDETSGVRGGGQG